MLFNSRILTAIIVVIGVPAVVVGYIAVMDWLVSKLPIGIRERVRPWLWAGPVIVLLAIYLVYPTINTIYLSFLNRDSTQYVGLQNYIYVFTDSQSLNAMRNNIYWLVLLTGLT
ncbi:MAG TPA: hypothetical protein VE136_18380, partial [Anaerolineales bacterium]|nr:hypothetical protein [Anaerolineales bacterium]